MFQQENQTQSVIAERIVNYLSSSIKSCNSLNNPFSHAYFKNCFPDNIYKNIISNLPDPELYSPIHHRDALRKDGTSTRGYFGLSDENCSLLPSEQRDFWFSISEALRSPIIKQAIFSKLRRDLVKRFHPIENDVDRIEAYPNVGLFRDEKGYKILPHPDTLEKIVTVQFYFPVDLSQSNLGTSIYKRKTRVQGYFEKLISFPSKGKFLKIKTFDFLPNTGYCFAVSDKSWHGRDIIGAESCVRNTLMLIYTTKPNLGYLKDTTLEYS